MVNKCGILPAEQRRTDKEYRRKLLASTYCTLTTYCTYVSYFTSKYSSTYILTNKYQTVQ
jgi:hypothetical protein